jgi:RNA polymerase sigma-70 factor (ECF subfamily)
MRLKINKSASLEEVVRGCRKRNPKAQTELFNRFSGRFTGICRRYVGTVDQAEDIMIGGFMKIFEKIHQFKGEGRFEAWMTRIMVNESLSYIRRNKNMWLNVSIESADKEPDYKMADSQLDAEQALLLIDELPIGYRTVFNLYVMEGFSHKEIGNLLQITEGASKSQLSRAKVQLKSKILALEEKMKKRNHGKK